MTLNQANRIIETAFTGEMIEAIDARYNGQLILDADADSRANVWWLRDGKLDRPATMLELNSLAYFILSNRA
jgi:hypothetical protein